MRLALLLPFLALPLCAQVPNITVKGREIIDKAFQAMGGEAYANMKDRVETGRGYSFYRENLSGLSRIKIYTRYLTRPEPPQPGFIGLRERQVLGKSEDVYILFGDIDSYETTWRGAKPLPAEQVERWRESLLHNILYTLRQRLGEPGLQFYYQRSEMFENQSSVVVDIDDAAGRVTTVWFSLTSGLPLKQVWFRRDPQTKRRIEEVTIFAKYRDVGGGVQWPFVLRRERDGEKISELFFESVEINQGLTDELFTLSATQKILQKKKK